MASLNLRQRGELLSSKRGLTYDQVKARGYKQWADVTENWKGRKSGRNGSTILAEKMFEEFGNDFNTVPGFGVFHKKGRDPKPWCGSEWMRGMFLPCRDPRGRILGAQIKPSKGSTKYLSLSKPKYCVGARCSTLTHFSRPTGFGTPDQNHNALTKRVILTEGILKADIASDYLGLPVIASSGQTFDIPRLEAYLRGAFSDIENLEVIIALDEDTKKSARRNTDRAKQTLLTKLHSRGFKVKVATWNPEEGKGIDDFLLGGGTFADIRYRRMKPRMKRSSKLTPEEMELLPELVEDKDDRPTVPIEDQRRELLEKTTHLLQNRSQYRDKVLLFRHLPGVGKSFTMREAIANETALNEDLRVSYFVPTHDVGTDETKDSLWFQVYGRNSEKAPRGMPCSFATRYAELSRAGVPGSDICKACPAVSSCKLGKGPGAYYLSQFIARQRTFLPAQHFLSPSLVKGNVLVLDDVDLDALVQSSALIVTENDLAENIGAANAEPDPAELEDVSLPTFLRPGLSLLNILADFRRYLVDEEAETRNGYPRGSELVEELSRWCEREGHDLDGALESARYAKQPNPLDGATLETAVAGPKAILGELVEVLHFELDKLRAGYPGWNSRFYVGNAGAGSLSFRIKRRHDLRDIADKYQNRPIIIANADVTKEQAQRWFPGREVIEINPKAELPKQARVWQYVDRRYGMSDLSKDDTQQKAIGEIRDILKKHPTGKVGIITHKFFEDVLKARFKDEKRLKYLHFFGQRSRNDCKDVRAFIVFGTPHPRESDLIEQTETLYYDGPVLNDEVRPYRAFIEDVGGQIYATHHRGFLDDRLQEQLEARTRDEMLQALYRCRPFNLDDPIQGHLLDGYDPNHRPEVDVYVFGTIPLGVPVRIMSKRNPAKPAEVENVLTAVAELVKGASKVPSYDDIHQAVTSDERPVSYRQVCKAIGWIKRPENQGSQWREDILERENPPRVEEPVPNPEEKSEDGWSLTELVSRGRYEAMRMEAEFWNDRLSPISPRRCKPDEEAVNLVNRVHDSS